MPRTTRSVLATAAVAVVATLTLSPAATAGPPDDSGDWTRERGTVLECAGSHRGWEVVATMYENDRHLNEVSVSLSRGDRELHAHRTPQQRFTTTKRLRVGAPAHHEGERTGHRIRVAGSLRAFGPRLSVNETFADAGQQITTVGHQRRLATDLVVRYRSARIPVDCQPAFRFDLWTKSEPIAEPTEPTDS